MTLKPLVMLVAALLVTPVALAQQAVPWGSSDKPTPRESIEGMKTYYEPARVEHKGDIHSFTLYRSSTPGAADEAGRYMINCATRELVSIVKGVATPPARLIAGEALYPIARKLCEWDPPGIFKKLFD